ncbi:MAG: tetratricopeptide repeat protein [Dissulfuribacterales bacterium]
MKASFKVMATVIAIAFLVAGCSNQNEQTVEQLNKETIQLLTKQEIPKAHETAQKALKLCREKYGEEDLRSAECLKNMAIVCQAEKDFKHAESFYKKALALLEKHGESKGQDAAQIMNNLAAFAYMRGEYDQAACFYKKCLDIAKKVFPAGDKRISVIETNLKRCTDEFEGKGQNKSGAVPSMAKPETPDLVPEQIKKYVVSNLAKQNIYLSDFKPWPLLKIGDKGVVFPYTCIKKDEKNGEGIKAMILFAAVHDKTDKTKYIFQQTRLVSFEAYNAKLSDGGIPMLEKEVAKLFPYIFS